jgi:hypothetical protein
MCQIRLLTPDSGFRENKRLRTGGLQLPANSLLITSSLMNRGWFE